MVKYTEEFLANAKRYGIECILSMDVPNCLSVMEPTFVEYIPDEMLEINFPVLELYLNPLNVMQGGFISAAFDNAFGFLKDLVTKSKAVTLDLSTSYHRPIYKDDNLTIKVYMKHRGNTIVSMYAESFNDDGKLIATSTSKMMILK